MTKLTIDLPDDLAADMRADAASLNVSESEVVCERVRSFDKPELRPGDIDPLTGLRILPFEYLFEDGDGTLSTRVDEILAESFADYIEADSFSTFSS